MTLWISLSLILLYILIGLVRLPTVVREFSEETRKLLQGNPHDRVLLSVKSTLRQLNKHIGKKGIMFIIFAFIIFAWPSFVKHNK